MRIAALLALTVALAFSLRVIPSYRAVMTPHGVNFQDNDSWFHMRAIHDAAAHFPRQSTFDPYDAFPGGAEVPVDRWDLAVAGVAWILGMGKPDAHLVDVTGAWAPAVLGALLVIPVFLLGRRLFGELAGLLSGVAIAVIPGTLLWETHLGVPDHHVAEGFLAILALLALCAASDSAEGRVTILSACAGLSLGAYLCVRPAGIFVPGTFALGAILVPPLAFPATVAIATGSLTVLLCSGQNGWSAFTLLALSMSLGVCALVWGLSVIARRKKKGQLYVRAVEGACAIGVALLTIALKPALVHSLWETIRYYLPNGHSSAMGLVNEMSPLWSVPPGGFASVFQNLGSVWILALPVLLVGVVKIRKVNRPAAALFALWSGVMIAGGIIQLRMTLYTAPVLAILAGAGLAWAIDQIASRNTHLRIPAAVFAIVLILATNLPASIRAVSFDGGIDSNWRAALEWLKNNSPEPMGASRAGSRLWLRPRSGNFPYPPSAYGVLTWWDYGYQVSYLAHRIPNANGAQIHAGSVAQFLTATSSDRAQSVLKALGTKYAILDPTEVTSYWHAIVLWAGGDDAQYRKRVFAVGPDGKGIPLFVYLPDFYRSMASRLYIFDGKSTGTNLRFSVFVTRRERAADGSNYDLLVSARDFPTQEQAWDYMAASPGESMILGSLDPTVSCVELEDLPWAKRVFTSDETPLRAGVAPRAVKVFEVTPGLEPGR